MNKIVLLHFYFFLVCYLNVVCNGQDNRGPVSPNAPVTNIAVVPAPVSALQADTLSTEQKNQIQFNTGATKRISPKGEDASTMKKPAAPTEYAVDKNGNMVQRMTVEQKMNYKPKDDDPVENTSNSYTSQDVVTPTDFRVIATQEVIPPSINLGTEKTPGQTSAKKEISNTPETPVNNTTPKIGKISFLKQYVEELRSQVEKNRNNPDYPLEEKLKELKDIEDLLKQE